MPDIEEYTDAAFKHGAATALATEHNSLSFATEWDKSPRRVSGKMTPEAMCIMGKKPSFSLRLLDPSILLPTGFTETTNAQIAYRKYAENGGLGSAYKTLTFAKAILVPKSLSVSESEPAALDVDVLGLYSGGSCVSNGSLSVSPGAVTKCFAIKNAVLGGVTIDDIESLNVNWNFTLVPRPVFEPESFHYTDFNISGSINMRDLAQQDDDNALDGKSETVVITLIDRESAEELSLSFGLCDVEASIDGGGKLAYNFNSLS